MTSGKGQFKLGKGIGKGGFGEVFECFDKKNGKKFAMKKIKLEKRSNSNDEIDSAKTEAKLLTSLQNEYILQVVTSYQESGFLCIVTDFCDQGDLAQFLEERNGKPLDEERIVEWFRQICSALEYLHGRDVLHRDVKIANIFLTGKEMTVKLGDFGTAIKLENPTQKVQGFRGSPYYMSPEIYDNKYYDCKTDIWAMGVCVYQMVALKLPFDAPQMPQLVSKIIHDELPPLPEGYSRELKKIIERMMSKDTEKRPSASELLQNALFKNCKIWQMFMRLTRRIGAKYTGYRCDSNITRMEEGGGSLIDVRNIFKGMFIVVYVYDSCNDVEIDLEEFTTLSIPIVDQSDDCTVITHHGLKKVTLASQSNGVENGLAALTQIEEYEKRQLPCRICDSKHVEGTEKTYKRKLVLQPPPVLVIHIDRYEMSGSSNLTKNSKQMSYSRRLDVSQFCSIANTTMSKQDYLYELYAVVVHTGEINGGHYNAFVNTTIKHDVKRWEHLICKSNADIDTLKREAEIILQEKRNEMVPERTEEIPEVKANWHYVSDQTVTPVSEEDVLSRKDAYILFYEVQ